MPLFLRLAGLIGAVLLVVQGGHALAQAYPAKPIRLIVPLGAGGASDVVARVIAEKLGAQLGQAVIVENRPGAEGVIGMEAAARSAPDGYTLVIGSSTTLAANFSLRSKLPFHPVTDFAPVAMALKNSFNMLVINPDVPAQNLREFIALAKAKPGAMFYGTGTSGSKICVEMFKTMAGVNITMVNYKSSPQALNDLMGGQVQLVCEPVGTSIAAVTAGKLRALGTTSPARLPGAPNIPTVAGSGVPGFEYSAWVGVFAPAGTPRPIVDKLSAEIATVLRQPETAAKIVSVGFDPMIGGPEELAALLSREIARAAKVVKDAGIQPAD
ncbi:MAG: tripartite tricarboxylate transporter substrate binding protein [Betaproteobacteria bacterium]|nr:tripartite tricarboxylate transporter substrate binding protein [Betaproteobacteria bacterium]